MPEVIEVKSLIKNYKDIQAVKGIDFTVREGSFFAFLGENGAGKSTTINIIATLIKKTSGDVTVWIPNSFEALVIIDALYVRICDHSMDNRGYHDGAYACIWRSIYRCKRRNIIIRS